MKFIAGDWGSTHLRLFLCDEHGTAITRRDGPGTAGEVGALSDIFDALTADWHQLHGPLQAVLCGMVGSNMGWTQAPYVACPVRPLEIVQGCVALRGGRVHIVPGLCCANPNGSPDFMRGEETQILGAVQLDGTLERERALLCLPGTHTKWVWLQDGTVRQFLTSPTGEVFAVLSEHSMLIRAREPVSEIDMAAFENELSQSKLLPEAQMLHRLFECRSRQLAGDSTAEAATAQLSALLISSDVDGALRTFSRAILNSTVYLIGAPALTRLYASALSSRNVTVRRLDGAKASLAGLTELHRRIRADIHHEC